jgi:hypothetical protein
VAKLSFTIHQKKIQKERLEGCIHRPFSHIKKQKRFLSLFFVPFCFFVFVPPRMMKKGKKKMKRNRKAGKKKGQKETKREKSNFQSALKFIFQTLAGN